jgi:hypothetical protein|tara:strand:+ start:1339 stop:1530 length:192 start_codon:yes stop_codon:yes gene_type:complete
MAVTLGKQALDGIFEELESHHGASSDYDTIFRDAHLGIALSDARRDISSQVDPRVASLIEKYC